MVISLILKEATRRRNPEGKAAPAFKRGFEPRRALLRDG